MQTTYNSTHAPAFGGMLADDGPRDIGSYTNETASPITYGRGVKQGASDGTCSLPSTASDALLGVLVHNQMFRGGILPKGTADVLKKGRIYVAPEQEVSPDDPVFWRVIGTDEVVGGFRRDDDGGAAVPVPNARRVRHGHPDKPAVLDLNIP